MIFGALDAKEFSFSYSFYKKEFEEILNGIIDCYNCIFTSKIQLPNNENGIRDFMLKNYLQVESFKRNHFNLANYHFDLETDENGGRADIRVLPVKPYVNSKAYYIIECKRLNNINKIGKTGLNSEYVKNGICRFVSEFYSSYFGLNGMIGFVVDDLITETNIENLNSFLDQNLINDKGFTVNSNPIQQISNFDLNENFKYSYISKHLSCNRKEIVLYHLMFDFSKNTI